MSVEQVSGSAWAECPNGVESADFDRYLDLIAVQQQVNAIARQLDRVHQILIESARV